MEHRLEIHALTKSFGDRCVFADWSHKFDPGFHGITGPNGIGKSTLLAMLAGAIDCDAGTITLNGATPGDDPDRYRLQIGYAPDRLDFYPFITVGEFWRMAASAKSVFAPDEHNPLVEAFKLSGELNTRLDALSLGTRKKVLLVSALINEPLLLLLDEPTDELDTNSTDVLIQHLKGRTAITIISTHDVDLLEHMGAINVPLTAQNP